MVSDDLHKYSPGSFESVTWEEYPEGDVGERAVRLYKELGFLKGEEQGDDEVSNELHFNEIFAELMQSVLSLYENKLRLIGTS